MKNKAKLDEKVICEEYINTKIGIEKLALKYHVGKAKIKDVLTRNGIEYKKRGGQNDNILYVVNDYKINKYEDTEDYYFIVKDLKSDFVSRDIRNEGGKLTSYIKERYGVEIPSLYDRRKHYMTTGNYWWEQYLVYEKKEREERKHCPFCDWNTSDVTNKSGCFEQHLKSVHNIDKSKYLTLYPEDTDYFRLVNPSLNTQFETNTENYVTCKVCGRKMKKICNLHLKTHNMTREEYILKYGNDEMLSKDTYDKLRVIIDKVNVSLDENVLNKFTSKAEKEIIDFLTERGVECGKNRKILHGQELDIFIPSKNVAIEYNGNMWHTEGFGKKDRNYHLNKLKACNAVGVKLIQICDDEYIEHKDIVMNKISHIVGIDNNKEKIFGRKCTIQRIHKFEADEFLNKNHIQGTVTCSCYLGCFYKEKLVAVMAFKKGNMKNHDWELSRFASDIHYNCVGVGGKMFKYFINEFNPYKVYSFADRRWTVDIDNNLYTKIGFVIENILRPDYKYYSQHGGHNKRIHKMLLSKKNLAKKYNMDLRLTESEMAKELGYDRIWDCGLIKYVYTNPSLVS